MFKKIIGLALIQMTLVSSALAKDTLYLKNGDQITGSVTSHNEYFVRMNTKYGPLRIPVADLQTVNIENQTKQSGVDNAIAESQIAPKPMVPTISSLSVPATAIEDTSNAETVVSIEEEKGLWGAEWDGNVNIGANLKTGNSDTTSIAADGEINAEWQKHRARLEAEYNFEEDNDDRTVDNRSVTLGHDYFFVEKWFIGSEATFQQDDIDKLDWRTILSTGLGYQPYKRDDLNLKFVLGPGYIKEEFEDGSGDSSATANWDLDYNQKFYDDLFRLFHNHDLTVPTDDFDSYIFQSESGVRVPIRRGIVASGQIDFDWDNNPAAGTVEDDTTYAVKLGYEW